MTSDIRASEKESRTDRYPVDGRTARGYDLPLGRDTPVELVPVRTLELTDSPRLGGENPDHTHVLAEIEGPLPPIIVHRSTRRVIDGFHRVKAATIRGQEKIAAQFFDGSEADAFVQAVKANITHGLPLSLGDRRAAAERIIASHPYWSDRAVAAATGLAPRTVQAVRRETTMPAAETDRRVGLDGRSRPLNRVLGRRIASEIIAAQPDASLREIARAAGISPTTVRNVRQRMLRGEPVAPSDDRAGRARRDEPSGRSPAGADGVVPRQSTAQERAAVVESLRSDPSLRFTDTGRALLRWLLPRAAGAAGWRQVIDPVPPHCQYLLARFARQCAHEWLEVAEYLDQRIRMMP